jgi:transporter family-2 protein
MLWAFVLLALVAGSLFPLQAGINSRLAGVVGHPLKAALVSFAVGFVVLLVYSFTIRKPWPSLGRLGREPWWLWTGGLCGVIIVFTTIVGAPRLGAAVLISLIVAGQMISSILLDHVGAVGFSRHPLSVWRVVGALLLLGGVVLIRRF